MPEPRHRFHLAFPVDDLAAARHFYVNVLGCSEGRSAPRWVDFDMYGHQLSAHLIEGGVERVDANAVDGDAVPVRHFGCILSWDAWEALGERLRSLGVPFRLEPRVRFKGLPGEQGTFFVDDPAGNCLEFKSFREDDRVFTT